LGFLPEEVPKMGLEDIAPLVSELLDLNFKTEMESYFQEFLKFQIDFS
jgi:hypothetical protein